MNKFRGTKEGEEEEDLPGVVAVKAKPKRGENEPRKRNGIAVALNFSISFNLHEAHRRRTQEIFESTPPADRLSRNPFLLNVGVGRKVEPELEVEVESPGLTP